MSLFCVFCLSRAAAEAVYKPKARRNIVNNLQIVLRINPWQGRGGTMRATFLWSEEQPAIICSTYSPLDQVAFGGSATPPRTVACVPHPPSPTQTDVSAARRHAHPDQQRRETARTDDPQRKKKKRPPRRRRRPDTRPPPPVTLNEYWDSLVVPTVLQQGISHPSTRRRGAGACAVLPPRYTSCSEGSICLRSICPAVTRSGRFARDV